MSERRGSLMLKMATKPGRATPDGKPTTIGEERYVVGGKRLLRGILVHHAG